MLQKKMEHNGFGKVSPEMEPSLSFVAMGQDSPCGVVLCSKDLQSSNESPIITVDLLAAFTPSPSVTMALMMALLATLNEHY